MSQQETLGQYITRMREAAGKSMREISRELGISFSVIHAWENDKYQPRRHLESLAIALDIHPNEIRSRLKDKSAPKSDHPYRAYKSPAPVRPAAAVQPYQSEQRSETAVSASVKSNLSDLNIRRAKRIITEHARILLDMAKLARTYGDDRVAVLADMIDDHVGTIAMTADKLLEGEPLGE
jgi:transcriptional regulator with XRE-family HTH domain